MGDDDDNADGICKVTASKISTMYQPWNLPHGRQRYVSMHQTKKTVGDAMMSPSTNLTTF